MLMFFNNLLQVIVNLALFARFNSESGNSLVLLNSSMQMLLSDRLSYLLERLKQQGKP